MPYKLRCVFSLFISLVCISCSTDDGVGEPTFHSVIGTVQNRISCRAQDDFVQEIELVEPITVSTGETFGKIGVVNLPEKYKMEGTRLVFDMRPATADELSGPCVTLYNGPYFFALTKVDHIAQY